MSGRDRGEPSAREVQAAMETATQVDTFGDRRGEVQAAVRDVVTVVLTGPKTFLRKNPSQTGRWLGQSLASL